MRKPTEIPKTHKRGKTETERMLDQYTDKIAEIFKPQPMSEYVTPEPIRFRGENTKAAVSLAWEILAVLEGHTIEEIVNASNVVEQFVIAQSKGQWGSYVPVMRGK
jgi:hypothetical protein